MDSHVRTQVSQLQGTLAAVMDTMSRAYGECPGPGVLQRPRMSTIASAFIINMLVLHRIKPKVSCVSDPVLHPVASSPTRMEDLGQRETAPFDCSIPALEPPTILDNSSITLFSPTNTIPVSSSPSRKGNRDLQITVPCGYRLPPLDAPGSSSTLSDAALTTPIRTSDFRATSFDSSIPPSLDSSSSTVSDVFPDVTSIINGDVLLQMPRGLVRLRCCFKLLYHIDNACAPDPPTHKSSSPPSPTEPTIRLVLFVQGQACLPSAICPCWERPLRCTCGHGIRILTYHHRSLFC